MTASRTILFFLSEAGSIYAVLVAFGIARLPFALCQERLNAHQK
jgi:hypothetical protein